MQSNLSLDTFSNIDDGVTLIGKALDTFLRDKRLQLTNQQYDRLKKLLMVCALRDDFSEDGLTFASVYNFLTDIFEYRKDYEINANASEEAQEEILHIVASADVKEVEVLVERNRYKKRFAILAFMLIIASAVYGLVTIKNVLQERTLLAIHASSVSQVITTSQEAEIKSIVWKIIELEKARGRRISANSLYNLIKNSESVTQFGEVTSYKKLNQAQFIEAVKILRQRLSEAN